MANGLHKYTVQEAVAPYHKSLKPDADTATAVCRAVVNETNSALAGVELTLADGSTVVMTLNVGVIYPLSCTQTDNANVTFLY
tara:strand:+ start:5975 stop:6223 length:249 start_codon:yes stop_codon:yes gene_type:complete